MKPLNESAKFFLGTTVFFILSAITLFYGLKFWMAHPSDSTLISNFEANKPQFEKLINMIQEDKGLERVDDNWTRPENPASIGVSDDRIKSYRQLFKSLEIPRGFSTSKDPININLIASASGLSVSGSSKGYAYREVPPDLVVDELDDYMSSDGHSFTAFKRLEGNWYLFYDYED